MLSDYSPLFQKCMNSIQASVCVVKLCYNDRRLAMVAQELVEEKDIVYQVGLKGAADLTPPQ